MKFNENCLSETMIIQLYTALALFLCEHLLGNDIMQTATPQSNIWPYRYKSV